MDEDWEKMDDEESELLRSVDRLVETAGWACMGIGPDKTHPTFSYTVGYLPETELIVIGIPATVANDILREAVDAKINANGRYGGVLRGYDIEARRVTHHDEHFRPAIARIWRESRLWSPNFELFQLVWPDKEGRFPPESDSGQPELARF